jgi:hypothetical protein
MVKLKRSASALSSVSWSTIARSALPQRPGPAASNTKLLEFVASVSVAVLAEMSPLKTRTMSACSPPCRKKWLTA